VRILLAHGCCRDVYAMHPPSWPAPYAVSMSWSCCACLPSEEVLPALPQMMEAPIMTLVRFWENHHLLDLVQRPVWRVVKDRSRSYVNAICAGERHACPAHQASI
jgi:hypothetical protein